MDAGSEDPAEVLGDSVDVRTEVRSAVSIEVDAAVLAAVERRLDDQRPVVAAQLAVTLDGREGAGFLRYRRGGFYRRHRDRGDLSSWPEAALRRVTLVLFLNEDFEGGRLRLWVDDATPIDVAPSTGTLVAFQSTTIHEVTPVGAGVRDVVVDWYRGG